jgi:hypothetical protein
MLVAPLRSNKSRGYVSRGASMPAPIEGWDDVSPIADMSPKRALILDNWFPQPAFVELRKGWAEHSDTTETTPVQTLMAYHAPNGSGDKLFAASNDTIYDVTSSTAAATSITSLTNAKIQHVNFTTSGGSYLYCVNGQNNPVHYDGSAWATPAITGVDESTFIHLNVFKNRLFFIPVSSTKFWYLPVDSIAGAVTSFELGGLMSLGGFIMAMGTITIDGGSGPDDHAVFITSEGQAIVYQGSDPSDTNAWALVGVYNIPPPIGRRCLSKIAGDLGILTISGVLPLSKAMVIDRAAVTNVALTNRINTTMTLSARSYGNNWGWQTIVYPRANMFIVNIPIGEGGESHQYVMNTLHGAWCRFIGQNAACFEVFQDRLFFGGQDGKVYEADKSSNDGGAAITADMKTAFNYYGTRGRTKQWKMVQTLVYSDGRAVPAIRLNTDYTDALPTYIPTSGTLAALFWNNFTWNQANWPSSNVISQRWQSVSGEGDCAAIRVRVIADSTSTVPIRVEINGFHVIYEIGGFL